MLFLDRLGQTRAKYNEEPELPSVVAFTMLHELRLNGDDVEAWVQRGAASIFVTGRADKSEPDFCSPAGTVSIWQGRKQLVVKEQRLPRSRHRAGRAGHDKWSIFRCCEEEEEELVPSEGSYYGTERLAYLMTRLSACGSPCPQGSVRQETWGAQEPSLRVPKQRS